MSICAVLFAAALSLDGAWDFQLLSDEADSGSDGAWKKIAVPSCWEMKGFGAARYGEGDDGANISGESGLYRRSFVLPADFGSRVFLRFDGVQFGAVVRVNGKAVADFTSSYNRHEFEITDAVRRIGENVLVVKTHGRPKGGEFDVHDDWILHGIFRSVTLLSRPETYLEEWSISTKLDGAAADVTLDVRLSQPGEVEAALVDPEGKRVAAAKGTGSLKLRVENARTWSAETPCLYRLLMRVSDRAGAVAEELSEVVGLREITWSGRQLKVNGRPVKLRGVNHHDLSPVNGRAVTDDEQLRDVRMIKRANCNFVRLSHYPPSPAFLEYCDRIGLYVMDEVPFGHGDQHLNDESYGDVLRERARLTVKRDRNYASVLIWSVGNENPVTPITQSAAKTVESLDRTRPWCFPMQPHCLIDDLRKGAAFSKFGDLFNWHYPLVCGSVENLVEEWFSKVDRPYLFGEFSHSSGIDMGYLEMYWRWMRGDPACAGGAVWMFQDQGIVRRESPNAFDTHGLYGADGIVCSDRTPQIDYYELAAVFAPIECGELQDGKVVVTNAYDFLRLDEAASCRWAIRSDYADGDAVASGELKLPSIMPRSVGTLSLDEALAVEVDSPLAYLELEFFHRQDGFRIARYAYPLKVDVSAFVESFRNDFEWRRLPLFVRIDRRPTVARKNRGECEADYVFPVERAAEHGVEVKTSFTPDSHGVRVDYEIIFTRDFKLNELGVAFALPKEYAVFEWIGDGPYESYPESSALSRFGCWRINCSDRFFEGNRRSTVLAGASDGKGGKVALYSETPSDFVFERFGERTLVGHNAFVAGKCGRFSPVLGRRTVKRGESFRGSFRVFLQGHKTLAK